MYTTDTSTVAVNLDQDALTKEGTDLDQDLLPALTKESTIVDASTKLYQAKIVQKLKAGTN